MVCERSNGTCVCYAPKTREDVVRAIFDASTFFGEWDQQPKANQEVCYNMADAAIAAIQPTAKEGIQDMDGRLSVITPQDAAKVIEREIIQKPCKNAAALRGRLIDAGLKCVKVPHLTRWVRWAVFRAMISELTKDDKRTLRNGPCRWSR